MNIQDRWVLSRKRQYASAHLILKTNTGMRCHYPHFTGRGEHTEVKCLDSGLAKGTEPGLVCPASSPLPHLCIRLLHPGNSSACLRRPPNQSAKWLKLVNVQSTSRPLQRPEWSALRTEVNVWTRLHLMSLSKVWMAVLPYPMFHFK